MTWLERIADIAAREGPVVRVVIVETTGPTPRAVGAAMLVWRAGQEGKIGRGEVEARAAVAARGLIGEAGRATSGAGPLWMRARLDFPTGHVLGASTGGRIELLLEVFGPQEIAVLDLGAVADGRSAVFGRSLLSGVAPLLLPVGSETGPARWRDALQRLGASSQLSLVKTGSGDAEAVIELLSAALPRFHVYGSGLVARALVKVLAELPFEVVWIDTAPGHFPSGIPADVRTVVSDDPARLAGEASPGGLHAVMTADHDCDLAVTRALLQSGSARYLGVIGSRVKRERLVERLSLDGIDAAALAGVACPIGLPGVRSKNPAVVAVAIAAQALVALQRSADTDQDF
jgi:xanthine dehydrogenase accessory factor